MNNLWRKSFMAGILSVSLTAGAVTPAFASAAPDGKTDATSLAGGILKNTTLTQQKKKKNRLHRSSPLSQVMLSVTAVNLSLQEQKPILQQQVKQWKQHRLKRQNQM